VILSELSDLVFTEHRLIIGGV